MDSNNITLKELAGMMDHTNLKAYATEDDFRKLCQEAADNGYAMVAINSSPVSFCKSLLKDTPVHVGAAVSFPLGQTTIEEKVAEARMDIENGADEIDYVLNIGELKMGHLDYIRREMEAMVKVCHEHNVLIKVIFENCYLTKNEIKAAAKIAKEVKPDFIKTSTGFGTTGATVEDVKIMKETVGDGVKIKAAGGIRDWETCAAMIDAGAERIGTSSSAIICQGYLNARKEG